MIEEAIEKPKKERKKRVKKEVSVLDESIKLELKKGRIFSRVTVEDKKIVDNTEFYNTLVDLINRFNKENSDKKIYILDKFYVNNLCRYLTGTPDAFTVMVNNDEVYNQFRKELQFNSLTNKLFFYDEINGLQERASV